MACGFMGYYLPPTPDPPKTLLELGKQHEATLETLLESMPEVQQYMLYKLFYAKGIRLDACDRMIDKLLKQQLRAQQSP